MREQIGDLQKVYEAHKDAGFVAVALPSNQFKQEPLEGDALLKGYEEQYGVTYPVLERADVNGDDEHPLFAYLKEHVEKGGHGKVKWNFEKFLVDRDGTVLKRYLPITGISKIEKDIKKLLEE